MKTTRAAWNISGICEDWTDGGETAMRAVSRKRQFDARKPLSEVRKWPRELTMLVNDVPLQPPRAFV